MTTISVPLNKKQEDALDTLIQQGLAENRASLMRKALDKFAKDEAVARILRASKEPSLHGELRTLAKRLRA